MESHGAFGGLKSGNPDPISLSLIIHSLIFFAPQFRFFSPLSTVRDSLFVKD
jgi:hypothetical protein